MAAAVGGYTELRTRTNGELPEKTWKIKLTDKAGLTQTWSTTAILQDFSFEGPVEGGVKYNIGLKLTSEPVIT